MKLKIPLLTLLVLATAVASSKSSETAKTASSRILQGYGKSREQWLFDGLMRFHRSLPSATPPYHFVQKTSTKAQPRKKRKCLIATSFFKEGASGLVIHNWVYANGESGFEEDVINWAYWGGRRWNLNAMQMAKVKAMVSVMPPSEPPKSFRDLLVVTYYKDGKQITRLYDTRNPPAGILDIGTTEPRFAQKGRYGKRECAYSYRSTESNR